MVDHGISIGDPMTKVKGFKIVVKSDEFMKEYVAVHGMLPKNELPRRMKRIPKNQIWIRSSNYRNEEGFTPYSEIVRHESDELKLMHQGLPYKDAHDAAIHKHHPKLPVIYEHDHWLNTITDEPTTQNVATRLNRYFAKNPKGTLYEAYGRPKYREKVKWIDQSQAVTKLYKKKTQVVRTKDVEGKDVYYSPLMKKIIQTKEVKEALKYDFVQGIFKVSLYRMTVDKTRVYHTITTHIGHTITDASELDEVFKVLKRDWVRQAMKITKEISVKYPLGKQQFMYVRFFHTMYFTQYKHSMDGSVDIMTYRQPNHNLDLMPAELQRAYKIYHSLLHTYHTVTIHDVRIYIRSWSNQYTKRIASKRLGVFKRNGGHGDIG
jgi:hypothetical protein